MSFFFEVLLGGMFSGVLYSLVAIGFVLIYRASGVFNFAQGATVLFAALTFVSLLELQVPFWLAFALTLLTLVILAVLVERVVLRPLLNRPPVILFMATLGLSVLIEGVAQLAWGTQVHGLDIGISEDPIFLGDILLNRFDVIAAGIAAVLVVVLALMFGKTRIGLSLRAVADDSLAAQSVGIRLDRVLALVWAVAGFVALVTGIIWGARLGVQFSLSLVVLKALPVLIIGGFGSINGAILAGLIVGASEKLAEIYLGPIIGSGIENWFPYALAVVFLCFKPDGLFGQPHVARV